MRHGRSTHNSLRATIDYASSVAASLLMMSAVVADETLDFQPSEYFLLARNQTDRESLLVLKRVTHKKKTLFIGE